MRNESNKKSKNKPTAGSDFAYPYSLRSYRCSGTFTRVLSNPSLCQPTRAKWLGDPILNLSGLGRHDDIADVIVSPAEYEFEMKTYTLKHVFSRRPYPGHSIGSVSFIFDDFVVSGDALFRGSIGRTDLYTGNLEQLLHSIRTQLFVLPDEFAVYPGHGDATTIEQEKGQILFQSLKRLRRRIK